MVHGDEVREVQVAADLVTRIMAGDKTAESLLVRRYSQGLLFFLRRRTGDPALSDDLHQETFCLVLEKIRQGQVGQPEKLAGYIHRVASNLVIADYRKSVRWIGVPPESVLAGVADASADPHTGMTRQEEAEMVRQVIAAMDQERDRQILYRYYLAEEDKKHILAELDLETLHFNRVLYRAKQRFAELWRTFKHRSGQTPKMQSNGKKPTTPEIIRT